MDITSHQPLHLHNTLRFRQHAEYFCTPTSDDELLEALAFARSKQLAVFMLGGGSNIVLTKNIPGLTIHLKKNNTTFETSGAFADVLVSAGTNWHNLVAQTIKSGLYGLENLSLIPGNVGAAPIQNIGAYGVEIADVLLSVHGYLLETSEPMTLSLAECEFGYRDSIFKHKLRNRMAITAIKIRLSTTRKVRLDYRALADELASRGAIEPDAKAISDAVCAVRMSKLPDPSVIGNAGSFFKNPLITEDLYNKLKKSWPTMPGHPENNQSASSHSSFIKVPAGWLIDKAGWRGHRTGEVGVHKDQALVLVNLGNGDGTELLALAEAVRASVKKEFGIDLEQEPTTM